MSTCKPIIKVNQTSTDLTRLNNFDFWFLPGHQRSVFGADFLSSLECPHSSQLMTWSTDCSIRVWDIEKVNGLTRAIDSIYHMGFPIFSCSINHWGDKIVVGGGSGDACCEGEAVPALLVHDIN